MLKNELEKRIRLLEDVQAIKDLKALYCYLADAGIAGDPMKWDELMTHFTDDACADFEPFGIYRGKEAISTFFKQIVTSLLCYSAHMVCNPLIQVNGSKAKGRWCVDVPCTHRETNRPMWLQARYEEEYVRVRGGWKWKSITARFDFVTPFDEGWVKMRMLSF